MLWALLYWTVNISKGNAHIHSETIPNPTIYLDKKTKASYVKKKKRYNLHLTVNTSKATAFVAFLKHITLHIYWRSNKIKCVR